MARRAVLGTAGLLLGAAGAVGWHYQPVFGALGAPRPFYQLLQAAEGPLYSGSMPNSALCWWHAPSWFPVLTLPPVGALAGVVLGAAFERATNRCPIPGDPVRRCAGPTAALGLFVGALSALAWHLDPFGFPGGPWDGFWFWPVEIGYPLVGLLLGLVLDRFVTVPPRPDAVHPDPG